VELTELSLGEVVDNRVVMVKEQPWVSPLADNWVLVAVMDEDVVYVVEIDPVFVHVRQAVTQAQASVIHNYARLTFKVAKLKNKTTESCHGLVCRG
jgi:hypothetical protein